MEENLPTVSSSDFLALSVEDTLLISLICTLDKDLLSAELWQALYQYVVF